MWQRSYTNHGLRVRIPTPCFILLSSGVFSYRLLNGRKVIVCAFNFLFWLCRRNISGQEFGGMYCVVLIVK